MIENRKKTVCTFVLLISFYTCLKISVIQKQFILNSVQSVSKSVNNQAKVQSTVLFGQKLETSGVIIHTKGGIGNQLFQYACSYALAKNWKYPIYNFIIRNEKGNEVFSKSRNFSSSQRDYALDKFKIPLNNFIDKTTSINLSFVSYISDHQLFYGNYSNNTFLQLDGGSYCQSELYWVEHREEIIDMFKLRPEVIHDFPPYVTDIEKEIENAVEPVAIHVRRGDFTRVTGFDIPISYQRAAIRRITKILQGRHYNNPRISSSSPSFFVFSDDIDYAKEKFSDFSKVFKFVFVSGSPKSSNKTTSLQDFYLMMKCKHFIIPNSTFAWWAAYLSTKGESKSEESCQRDRIVISSAFNPKFWRLWSTDKQNQKFNMMLYGQKYHPKEWIIINPFIGEH